MMNLVDFTTNLARGKPAEQSTHSIWSPTPTRAVDGNYDNNLKRKSCIQTLPNQVGSWWQVDLEAVYNIEEVLVLNRGDCCGE